jgi:tetratricopeptide (TPR) repeat protein
LFSGVGLDRYGDYFREYVAYDQLVQGQVSDNAHSIYFQLLATGGLVTIIPYILLFLTVTYLGFRSLLNADGRQKILVAGVFGIWLGSLILNLVTIDNLGVGVWMWIAGGALVGISSDKNRTSPSITSKLPSVKNTSTVKFPTEVIIAASLVVFCLVLLVPKLGNSSNLYTLKQAAVTPNQNEVLKEIVISSEKINKDTQYLIQLANLALTKNGVPEAKEIIKKVNDIDSRSYFGNYFSAVIFEAEGNFQKAIEYRIKVRLLDPWNNVNLIALMKDYLAVGDRAEALKIQLHLKKYFPESQSYLDASALLVG